VNHRLVIAKYCPNRVSIMTFHIIKLRDTIFVKNDHEIHAAFGNIVLQRYDEIPSLDARLARGGCQGCKTGKGSCYCYTVLHERNRKDKVA
jgi:hypothetical protein